VKQRPPLQVSLLGRFQVRLGSGASLRIRTRKAAALLAYLAVRPGHHIARPVLAALLWGEMGDEQARANLRHELFTLRRALGAHHHGVGMDTRDVWMDPDSVASDLTRFEGAVAAGGDQLAVAVDLYKGELLEGFALREEAFEDWLRAERERVRTLALDALERSLAACASAGRTDDARKLGTRALALDPLRESVHRALMRMHASQGARAEVVRQYQACVDVLKRELGATARSGDDQALPGAHGGRLADRAAAADLPPARESRQRLLVLRWWGEIRRWRDWPASSTTRRPGSGAWW
jgi:DNA-binding SARP family transcriptional activator